MRTLREHYPDTLVESLLAGLATWVTLLAWTSFAERPAGYMVPLFGGCLIVAVVGMLLRTARVTALLVLLAQVVVLLLWLHHRLAGDLAVAGWLPDPASIRATVIAINDSGLAAESYAAPVPRSVPEFYPLMILTGSMTAVLVDFLAVGLRRAPLAGLPLLAAYTAPVSVLDGGVSWVKFAAAALCFLFLIAAQEAHRLGQWGHQLGSDPGTFDTQATWVSGQAIWSSARKIGVTATGLAVIVPLFVPTFTATLFNGGNGGGDGDGNAVSISNPMVDLKRDLVQGADIELVRVTTADPDPSYLRLTVLDDYDGNAWRPSTRDIPVKQRADGPVARPPGLDATIASHQVRSTVQVSDFFKSRWLPTPYPVTNVDAPGDWRYDRSTLDFISAADDQTTAGLTYRLQALDLAPTATDLSQATAAPASVFTPNTALPRDVPGSVRKLAETVTQGRQSKFEQAVALQNWFRVDGGFRYSLQRSAGNGTNDLVHFLGTGKDSRVGYCEQFAAAMALMGRSLGIPSRVAVGFLRPDKVARRTYVYSSHDLHAWPEMYFGGVGWVRFEPTPQTRAVGVPPYTTQQVPRPDASASTSARAPAPSLNRIDRSTGPSAGAKSNDTGSTVANPLVLGLLVTLLLLALLAVLPRLARALVRRRRWSAATTPPAIVEAGWRELRDTAVDLGIAWDDRVSLRATAGQLVRSFGRLDEKDDALTRGAQRGEQANPEAASALHRLVRLVEQTRYARSVPDGSGIVEQVHADVAACVAALRAGAGRRRRSRATWLPASLGTSVRGAWRGPTRTHGGGLLADPGVDRAV
jgi:transglutaminase-like putative cysteine protease